MRTFMDNLNSNERQELSKIILQKAYQIANVLMDVGLPQSQPRRQRRQQVHAQVPSPSEILTGMSPLSKNGKRIGRPPGSKNKPKEVHAQNQQVQQKQQAQPKQVPMNNQKSRQNAAALNLG